MTFRAIATKPENAPVLKAELDLIIVDYDTLMKDYVVHGFDPPMEYIFYTKEEFDLEWGFFLGNELKGKFSIVVRK